jgi:two-component system chemotaxis response regulator CheB
MELIMDMPVPVVMVSSLSATGDAALKSLELGAVEFVHKPSQFDPSVLKTLAESLVSKVKAAASVNVLKGLRSSAKTFLLGTTRKGGVIYGCW